MVTPTARLLAGDRWIALPAAAMAAGVGYASAQSPFAALGAMLAAGIAYLVLAQAKAVMLLLVAVLPWENALKYPSATLSMVKILGALLVVAYLLRALAGRAPIRTPRTLVAVAALLIFVGVSLLASPNPAGGFAGVLRYVLFAAFFFLLVQLIESRRDVMLVLGTFSVSLALAGLWSLVLFFTSGQPLIQSPLGDPNDLGFLFATTLPLCGYLLKVDRPRRWLWGPTLAVLAAGTLTTLSRGALVGLAALAIWAIVTRRVRITGVLGGAAVTACVLLVAIGFGGPLIADRFEGKQQIAADNAAARLAFWSAAVYMGADHPLTGVGPDRFGVEGAAGYIRNSPVDIQQPVVHNSYLEFLAENGVLTLIAFLAFLVGSWRLLSEARRAMVARGDADGATLAGAVQAAGVVAVAAGAFISAQVLAPFWLLGALAVTVHYQARSSSAGARNAPVAPRRPPRVSSSRRPAARLA